MLVLAVVAPLLHINEDKYGDITGVRFDKPDKFIIPNFSRGLIMGGTRNGGHIGDGVETDKVETDGVEK